MGADPEDAGGALWQGAPGGLGPPPCRWTCGPARGPQRSMGLVDIGLVLAAPAGEDAEEGFDVGVGSDVSVGVEVGVAAAGPGGAVAGEAGEEGLDVGVGAHVAVAVEVSVAA